MEQTIKRKRIINEEKSTRVMIIGNIDYIFFLCVTILVLLGIVMVFSASYYDFADKGGNIFILLRKQASSAVLGFVAMFFASNFNYRYYKRLSIFVYIFSIILLIAVLFFGVSYGASTARRWLEIFGVNFQPSEIGKVGIVMLVSSILGAVPDIFKNIKGYLLLAVIILIPAFLTSRQPNYSTFIIMVVSGAIIMFIASPHIKIFLVSGLAGLLGVLAILFLDSGYKGNRTSLWLESFGDISKMDYQPRQALYAVGSGSIFGLGLGQGRVKLGLLPEAENDMIFSVICEELGFFGAAIVLILFSVVIIRGLKIAQNAPDQFGSYLATGITSLIAIQVIVNIAVILSVIPNTGVTLPFISYGGSSLVIFMGLSGILLNISRYSKEK